MHADLTQHRLCHVGKLRIVGAGQDHLDHRQQVDRVEWMGDDDLPGPRGALLQVRRLEPGCRRGDHRIGGAVSLYAADCRKFDLEPFGNTFLDPGRVPGRVGEVGHEADLAHRRQQPVIEGRV